MKEVGHDVISKNFPTTAPTLETPNESFTCIHAKGSCPTSLKHGMLVAHNYSESSKCAT